MNINLIKIIFLWLLITPYISSAAEIGEYNYLVLHDLSKHEYQTFEKGEEQVRIDHCTHNKNKLTCDVSWITVTRPDPTRNVWHEKLKNGKLTDKGIISLEKSVKQFCGKDKLLNKIQELKNTDKETEQWAAEMKGFCGDNPEEIYIKMLSKEIEKIKGTCKVSMSSKKAVVFNKAGLNQWGYTHLESEYVRLAYNDNTELWTYTTEQKGYPGTTLIGNSHELGMYSKSHFELKSYGYCKTMEFKPQWY